jgi:hypothetical protein
MTQQLALMSSEPARPGRAGRLDEETKRVGREGLSKARAALQEASRRAAEREADRLTRRDEELARRAAAARAAAQRRSGTEKVATERVTAKSTSTRRGTKATPDQQRPAAA